MPGYMFWKEPFPKENLYCIFNDIYIINPNNILTVTLKRDIKDC